MMNVGRNHGSTKLFQELLISTEYRNQCLDHAVCLNLEHGRFFQAKGSNLGVGEVTYVTIVHRHHRLTFIYSYCLAAFRVAAFQWIGKDASRILKAFDDLLQSTYSLDLSSYASYNSLSRGYLSLARLTGTLPSAQMILPTAFFLKLFEMGH